MIYFFNIKSLLETGFVSKRDDINFDRFFLRINYINYLNTYWVFLRSIRKKNYVNSF